MDAFQLRLVALLSVVFLTATPLEAQTPSAELAAILGKWQRAVSELTDFEIRGERIVYNSVFETEQWGEFNLRYHGPDHIRLEFQPSHVTEGAVSRRKDNRTGQPYRIEPAATSIFLWRDHVVAICHEGDGKRIVQGFIAEPPVAASTRDDAVPPPPALPEESLPWWQDWLVRAGEFYLASVQKACMPQTKSAWDYTGWSLLGLLFSPEMAASSVFAVDSSDFMSDMDWAIIKRTEKTVRLEGRPNSPRLKHWMQRLDVILDQKTGRPLAQRSLDSSGNLESVLVFKEWKTNPSRLAKDFDERKWDIEFFPLPAEIQLLKHRRAK